MQAEVRQLNTKMREAQSRLSKLLSESKSVARFIERRPMTTRTLRLDGKNVILGGEPGDGGDTIGLTVRTPSSDPNARQPGRSEQDRRLADLEKKLDRLADELSKLKKSKD